MRREAELLPVSAFTSEAGPTQTATRRLLRLPLPLFIQMSISHTYQILVTPQIIVSCGCSIPTRAGRGWRARRDRQ